MGDPEWSRAERFKDPRIVARKHGDEADTYLLPWLARHTKADLMDIGLKHGFPASPVRFVGEAMAEPQFAHRGSLRPLKLDDGSTVAVPSEPWRVYETAPAPPAARAWPLRPDPRTTPSRFLEGLRVLDLSWVWSGPLVTSVLADLGAEVIKIEHPSRLDSVRQRGRPVRDGREVEGPVAELNPWFNQLNHGKRSVVLDIKSAAGKADLLRLAASCDIVVENMRPGALDKLGLGYREFAGINPSIVMLSMSLVGREGPLAHMKGYAGIMTSMAGLEALVGHENDDGSQIVVGMAKTALGDPNAAGHAIAVLLAALHRRKTTGRGALIDLSQTDAILSILVAPLIESQLTGQAPIMGNGHPAYAPHGHFRCQGEERWVALSVQTESQWQRLVAATEPALHAFVHLDAAARIVHRTAVERALEQWTITRAQDDVAAALQVARVPVAPVADYPALADAGWHRRRGLVRDVVHPYIGEQQLVVPPWLFAGRSAGTARPAPLLGADTDHVLGTSRPGIESVAQPADAALHSEMSGT